MFFYEKQAIDFILSIRMGILFWLTGSGRRWPRRAATCLIIARLVSTALFIFIQPCGKLPYGQFPFPRPAIPDCIHQGQQFI
jgi:hypothetical protein